MDRFTDEYIELLSRKFKEDTLTESEREDFIVWYSQIRTDLDHSDAEHPEVIKDRMRSVISDRIQASANITRKPVTSWRIWAVAASLLLFCYIGIVLMKQNKATLQAVTKVISIPPGGNKAFLTLATGHKIDLTSAKAGLVTKFNGITVTKSNNGQLIYTAAGNNGNSAAVNMNTLNTPVGGQFQLILPDGTHVWMNASSSLVYPEHFDQTVRKVTLSGEAYFEVAHEKKRPFKVQAGNQEIEVLGTHFNINAYKDEPQTVTTLLEGSVRVNSGAEHTIIKPGEQAATGTSDNSIQVERADVKTQLAWKNGITAFKDADLHSVMRQISRWYDIKIIFAGPQKNELYTGGVSRSSNLSSLLEILRANDIHFTIKEEDHKNVLIVSQ